MKIRAVAQVNAINLPPRKSGKATQKKNKNPRSSEDTRGFADL
jgi:hypothetical protein